MEDLAGKIQSILNDEESLRQIKELAGMFMPPGGGGSSDAESGGADGEEQNIGNGFDSGGLNIGAIASMMGSFTESDKNSELLIALRPHLSDERRERVDKAVRMLKLYNVYINLKENGMLEGLIT